MRVGLAIAAAGLALCGCGGGEPAERSGAATSTQPRPAVVNGVARASEVAWAARALDWTSEIQARAEELVASLNAFGRGEAGALQRTRRSAAAAEDACRRPLPRPTTERLLKTHEKLLHFCAHLDKGLESVSTFVWMGDGATSHDVRAWFRDFDDQWRRGFAVARRAAREISGFAPSNARELPGSPGAADESYVDAELGAVATEIAGERAEVRCWSKRDWPRIRAEMHRFSNERVAADTAGFVAFGDHRINLAPEICPAIRRVRSGLADGRAAEQQAFALGTLTHEARHVAGTLNETTATCEGAAALADAARRLDLGGDAAAQLETIFRERVQPTLPAGYRAAPCPPR